MSYIKEDPMAHRHRHELSDAQWAEIQALLPGKRCDPGRTAADNRLFVNAVIYVLKTGIPWADLPGRFGKHDTVRKRFDRWCAAGVWEKIARATGDPDLEEVQLDATTIKAHPVASTGRRRRGEQNRTPIVGDALAAAAAG
jgi:putative transposase